MFSVTRLLDVVEDERDRMLTALRSAARDAQASRWVVQPTLPGSRNGGDILLHMRFTGPREWDSVAGTFSKLLRDPSVGHVNGASYHGRPASTDWSALPGSVYRTLLLSVVPGTDRATIARFEADLRLMPKYTRTITDWQLSRVDEASGASAWTHVFEQHFTDVDGLMGPYLTHPIHWAVVDRWFDPECPEVIVRDRVCHSFCLSAAAVLR
ncbi:Dabb family protein [Mycobacterium sp. E3339]|uniref:Dabb family protein n=1 Tax=Mycobacterium sp. E3339 TaxID=1834146 RepID=UPI0007FFFD46|nr:Dabb family protein [Mycobacterium sp. E3339]OBG59834.1 stress responsive protein [Mycobacterium sp. E3339]